MPFLSILSLVWGNEWGRLIAVGVLAAGFGWIKGFAAVPRVDVAQVQRVAAEARDNEWEKKLKAQELDSEKKITAALEAAASVPAIADDGELDGLCRKSSACRDKGGSKRDRVPGLQNH